MSAGGESGDFEPYVINLKRTPQRLATFLGQNSATGLTFKRFEAADGNYISQEDAVRLNLIKPGTKWNSRGAIGVALSHRNLWEKAISDGRPLLVFEDDAFIREDFREVFQPAVARLAKWDIILLGYNTDALVEFNLVADFDFSSLFTVKHPTAAQLAKFARSREPANLFRLRNAFGIGGYAISPVGAEKLIQRCFPMDNRMLEFRAMKQRFAAFSIDGMMNAFYRELDAYAFVGPLVLPLNDWEASTVEKRRR